MFDVSVTQVDEDTACLNTIMYFNIELPPKNLAGYLNHLEYIVKTEVEAYTGFIAEVGINPFYQETYITVYKCWDPTNLSNDIQALVVAAGYARDRIENEGITDVRHSR